MSLLRLTTSLWGHIFGLGNLTTVGRVAQSCKTLRSLLGLNPHLMNGKGSTLSLPTISLSTIGDDLIVMEKLVKFGTRHLECTGPFTSTTTRHVFVYMGFLGNLRSLHIGHVPTNEVWLAIVSGCERLESLTVDNAACPPLFSLDPQHRQATFDSMPHLRCLVLPQRPFRTLSSCPRVLSLRQRLLTNGINDAATLHDDGTWLIFSELVKKGDAYSLWCFGRLMELGHFIPNDDTIVIPESVEAFYRSSAARGFATAQIDLYRFLKSKTVAGGGDSSSLSSSTKRAAWSRWSTGSTDDTTQTIHVDDANDTMSREMAFYLHRAVMQSNVFALMTMASYCREELKDYTRMALYFRKAAEAGEVDAMHQIGYCHWNGLGVPMDDKEAYRWFQQAASATMYHADVQNTSYSLPLSDYCIPFEPGPPWRQKLKHWAEIHYHLALCTLSRAVVVLEAAEKGVEARQKSLSNILSCFGRLLLSLNEQEQGLRFSVGLHVHIIHWALYATLPSFDRANVVRHIMNLSPQCPQTLYWQSRIKVEYEGRGRGQGSRSSSRSSGDDDNVPPKEYWKVATACDHVTNARLELCFHPSNDRLIVKLLEHAASGITTTTTHNEAVSQIRACFMLGEAAERAGDMTLAKTWLKRAASSSPYNIRYVQAQLKLDQLTLSSSSSSH